MTRPPNISKLTDALHRLFVQSEHPDVLRILENWPETALPIRAQPAQGFPVVAYIVQALSNAPNETTPLVCALAQEAELLSWNQTYKKEDLGEEFLALYGWTTMFGSKGYIESAHLLSGSLLLGPGIEYPVHKHSPEEIYVVLSGEASWKIGEADWQVKPAGTIIHNPPWQLHGMRTDRGQPLLVAYLWNAGEVEKSQILGKHAVLRPERKSL